ncbi:AraC family transcriptional regulator N-terminal domain-containing protein [Pseudomonadota bacterium AL_CKDN230030165-1A_HGKHYDSX7]
MTAHVDPTLTRQTVDLVLQLAPTEGYTLTALPGVKLMRSQRSLPRTQVLYEPSIVIVFQGQKRGFLGDSVYIYDAQHYLVLSVPLPFCTETQATPEHPLLAMSIQLDMTAVADLVLAIDQSGHHAPAPPCGIISTPLDDTLAHAIFRLLRALAHPLEGEVLGPAIVREISYRVLMGEQGGAVRAALAQHGHFGKIAKALRRIHTDYARSLDVSGLADEAGMSVAAFHLHFRAVTQTSPIQYVKSTRLHQARLLMIRESLTAAAACTRVGYESPSQFNREFKRFFGRTPGEEADLMKGLFATERLQPVLAERYVATLR